MSEFRAIPTLQLPAEGAVQKNPLKIPHSILGKGPLPAQGAQTKRGLMGDPGDNRGLGQTKLFLGWGSRCSPRLCC